MNTLKHILQEQLVDIEKNTNVSLPKYGRNYLIGYNHYPIFVRHSNMSHGYETEGFSLSQKLENIDKTIEHFWDTQKDSLPDDVIVLEGVHELPDSNLLIRSVDCHVTQLTKLRKKGYIKRFTIVTDINISQHALHTFSCYEEVIVVPWFGMTYKYACPFKSDWNQKSTSVLFLPGGLIKEQRILPLYQLWKRNELLDPKKILYSCVGSNNLKESDCINMLDCIKKSDESCQINDTAELRIWLDSIRSDIDNVTNLRRTGSMHIEPVDVNIYNQVNVELISETTSGPGFITEKTFRPIHMGIPFVHVNTGITNWLQNSGYETFVEYIDQQDIIQDVNYSLTAVRKFAESKSSHHIQLVKEKIEHNTNHLNSLVNRIIKNIEKRHPSLVDRVQELFVLLGNFGA